MKNKKAKTSWIDLDLILIMVSAFTITLINMFIYSYKDPYFNNFMLFGLLFFSAQFYIKRKKLAEKTGFWIPVLAIYYMWNAFQYPIWSFFLMIGVLHSIADIELEKYKEIQENLDA